MRRVVCVLLATVVALASAPAAAAVVSRDWKTPGDGLLTYDDVNRREWLDIPQTRLSLFPGANSRERFQYVVEQTTAGGVFEGFTVAKSDDLRALAQSAGIDISTDDFSNAAATQSLIELVGPTVVFSATNGAWTAGVLDEPGGTTSFRRFGSLKLLPSSIGSGTAGLVFSNGVDFPGFSVWLYRTAVPEPSCAVMLLASIPLLVRGRPRSSKRVASVLEPRRRQSQEGAGRAGGRGDLLWLRHTGLENLCYPPRWPRFFRP